MNKSVGVSVVDLRYRLDKYLAGMYDKKYVKESKPQIANKKYRKK